MTQRDIYWRQGETLDITVPTELDLTGTDLVLRVRRRLSDEDVMLDIDSDGPSEARITAVEGGYRVQLGAAEGSLIQTAGRDARWVYAAKAIDSADPEIAAWMDYGDWVVKADPARAGEQVAPTPAGDLRYLQPAQIVAGSNVTITTSGTGTGLTLTFSATGGGGGGSVAWGDITGKPTFAAVATSGLYSDLSGRPTLGTAAALDVGTGAGTVAAGNDSRLSDARTPTAHNSTHATGGADALTPADIGAATALHTQAATTVTVDDSALQVIEGAELQAALASADTAMLNARSTGLRHGGAITSLGAGVVRIAAGAGTILDVTNPAAPVFYSVTWSQTDLDLSAVANQVYYIYVTSAGTVTHSTTPPTHANYRDRIYLHRVSIRSNLFSASAAIPVQVQQYAPGLYDLFDALGPIKRGFTLSAASTNLTIAISAGEVYISGIGFYVDPKNPNEIESPTRSPATFRHVLRDGTQSTDRTTLDVGNYDAAGVITAIGGSASRATIFTVKEFALSGGGNTRIFYGQTIYNTVADALSALQSGTYSPTIPATYDDAVTLGWIIAQRSATNLADGTQVFVTANRFGLTGGGVSTGAAALPATSIRETSGPTDLAVGAIADGQLIGRSGATAIGVTPALYIVNTSARSAQIPDSTATGGNARGDNAVDLQSARSSATQVANGSGAVIGGGRNNTSSRAESVVAGGTGNTASGDRAAVGGGESNAASAARATIAGGGFNAVSASNGWIPGGISGTTFGIWGAHAWSAQNRSAAGDNQHFGGIFGITTTDATPTVLTADRAAARAAANNNNTFVLPNNSVWDGYVRVVARDTSGNVHKWTYDVCAKRGANAAATAIVDSHLIRLFDGGLTGASISITANTTRGSVEVTVTGIAATTIDWTCEFFGAMNYR